MHNNVSQIVSRFSTSPVVKLGGELPYKLSDGNARWKIKIQPPRETSMGVAYA